MNRKLVTKSFCKIRNNHHYKESSKAANRTVKTKIYSLLDLQQKSIKLENNLEKTIEFGWINLLTIFVQIQYNK